MILNISILSILILKHVPGSHFPSLANSFKDLKRKKILGLNHSTFIRRIEGEMIYLEWIIMMFIIIIIPGSFARTLGNMIVIGW